jgi:hypothetical protein
MKRDDLDGLLGDSTTEDDAVADASSTKRSKQQPNTDAADKDTYP